MKQPHILVLQETRLLDRLARFSPVLIGTPPLGIDIPGSDIDVACSSGSLSAFSDYVTDVFSSEAGFAIRTPGHIDPPAVVATFIVRDWEIELFCQSLPTDRQMGVRHFRIEQRLLDLVPGLRAEIRERKLSGQKTEPAFADRLRLAGDPYQSLLTLETMTDGALVELVERSAGA
ncbi:DUF4269 domain-containing protein [Aestuariispira insulae]|uniref:Uncharacterized protein DUF4269 n=1 Tax=Aestuariispira insulae TaxID=1461337 RepID=A0A3D9HY42_9PROT|nr:DUF4269 domain-containing protein [Aestuariispira insulae]RED54335.1 uncharacterized protein DUF4269 [Aestuariispira insulae]